MINSSELIQLNVGKIKLVAFNYSQTIQHKKKLDNFPKLTFEKKFAKASFGRSMQKLGTILKPKFFMLFTSPNILRNKPRLGQINTSQPKQSETYFFLLFCFLFVKQCHEKKFDEDV